jgi:rhodanese-related sulfurtransferase
MCGEQCTAYKAAAAAAETLGYTNVKQFAPGISGWKNSGRPTEPDS